MQFTPLSVLRAISLDPMNHLPHLALQCEQLNEVQLPLPAQQARYLASLKHSATNYVAWDVQQRQQFCNTLLKVLASYRC